MGSLTCGDRAFVIGARTYVMGIVNVTPDSFSDGGALLTVDEAVAHALRLLDEGADVLDIGGESTRPGADAVALDVERARVLPVVEELARRGVRCICVDTRKAAVARDALGAGAAWVNDVSALRHDPDMRAVCTRADAVVLMHARDPQGGASGARVEGAPADAVLGEVHGVLAERVAYAMAGGVPRERIVVDPGVGFGKDVDENVALTRQLARFAGLGAAVLYGPSRKRFLGALAGVPDVLARDAATHGAVAFASLHGADLVRVHDVEGAMHALRVVDALRGSC